MEVYSMLLDVIDATSDPYISQRHMNLYNVAETASPQSLSLTQKLSEGVDESYIDMRLAILKESGNYNTKLLTLCVIFLWPTSNSIVCSYCVTVSCEMK